LSMVSTTLTTLWHLDLATSPPVSSSCSLRPLLHGLWYHCCNDSALDLCGVVLNRCNVVSVNKWILRCVVHRFIFVGCNSISSLLLLVMLT
jgi:hypothetical protein